MSIKNECFNILKDLEFHCSCEFPSSQVARVIKDLRNNGYVFWVNENGTRWLKNIYCEKCGMVKPHRKLMSLEKENQVINRVGFTNALRERILKLFLERDIFTRGTDRLEIDHRVTPERESEEPLPNEVTDEELKRRYMPLTRVNNHIKREACKKCIATDIRQPSLTGINFFYKGTSKYEGTCEGCFWAYPEEWRRKLNEKLEQ